MSLNRLRIGIVGLGFGKWIVEQIVSGPASEYMELAALCDLDEQKATALARQYGAKMYGSLDDLLSDASIPTVGLFTGPAGRAELVRRSIRAGKDVMTTKPFELDPKAALEVLTEAKHLGRIVHMNSPSPLPSADLEQIERWREEFHLGHPVGGRTETWAYYRDKADGTWYDDPRRCPVAPMFRLGIYWINDLVRLFGEPESVQVMQSRLFTGRPTADNAQLNILFRNGAIASVFASFCVNDTDSYGNRSTLNYENGTVRRDRTRLSLLAPDSAGGTRKECVTVKTVSGEYQWDVFSRAARGEALKGEITPLQIVTGLKVIAAMAQAAETGRTVTV